jgi:mono/diheme cytochrome c family protein
MNTLKKILLFTFLVSLLTACGRSVDSPRGFSLPVGDIEKGKLAFMKHNCLACHSIEGVDASDVEKGIETRIKLGTTSAVITTYAELVTSIINPSHRIYKPLETYTTDAQGHSAMRNYNDVMTVSELIDLVAYLQPEYKVEPLHITPYSNYYRYIN